MKFVLAGYPKTGKTTLGDKLAARLGYPIYHTDDTIELGSHADSQQVSEWFDEPGNWIVEGVTTPRAIRKWLVQHPGSKFPADYVVYFTEHVVPWENKGTFIKSLDTVWSEVRDSVQLGTENYIKMLAGVRP